MFYFYFFFKTTLVVAAGSAQLFLGCFLSSSVALVANELEINDELLEKVPLVAAQLYSKEPAQETTERLQVPSVTFCFGAVAI